MAADPNEDPIPPEPPQEPDPPRSSLPTGIRLCLILSAALLPLALFALFASLQTNRNADAEAAARLRVATSEAARSLAIELVGDMTALRVAINALEQDPGDAPSCARIQGVFASQIASGARFDVVDPDGRRLCGAAGMPHTPPLADDGRITGEIVPGKGVVLAVASDAGRVHGSAFFPVSMLTGIARPNGFLAAFGSALESGGATLDMQEIPSIGPLDRTERASAPVPIADLTLQMFVRSQPITSPLVIAMLSPMLMWLAATGIGWFVVDRLLIRPLRRLRASVSDYRPGETLKTVNYGAIPATEILALDDTFRELALTVREHEAELAAGLLRQTKLTREVHHRVKNNLQVISSLINLHSRSAPNEAATDAYASIQRRVDALAVVHRNHFAEMEENRGLDLRAVIGELASNIRATAPRESGEMGIVLDLDPLYANQDVSVAVSFLVTELVELAIQSDPSAQIRISLRPADTPNQAMLGVESTALMQSPATERLLGERYGRVITGLGRQLRSPLEYDPATGSYAIRIAAKSID